MATYRSSQQSDGKTPFFVNPYNFVPVNLDKTERGDVTQQNGNTLTGYLQCRIRCRTPLAIPDAEKKTEEKITRRNGSTFTHNKYPFFTINGKPVIPGSAIRGVIRNVYETLTDSCFGAMQGDVAITARSSKAFQPGLLKWVGNAWKLHKAERHLVVVDGMFHANQILTANGINLYDNTTTPLRKFYDSEMGGKIYFNLSAHDYIHVHTARNGNITRRRIGTYVEDLGRHKNPGWKEGYLCFGERSPKRHFQSIFEQKNLVSGVIIKNSDIQKMEDILEEYRTVKKNRLYGDKNKHHGYPDYEDAKKAGVIPVYYDVQKGKLYMTFAALGRKAYDKTWDEVTAKKSHRKCDGRNNLCPACALFGTAEGDKLGSKIRFTDANCTDDTEKVMKKDVTFAELGSPRLSYVPFYLKEKKTGANYADGYDSPDLEIRGRKFYWHHFPAENDVKKNNRNATFDVIKEDTEFEFRIYFDGITEDQLKLLEMSVHLNDNNPKGNMCHKMGHGKPLGYGSVKISIDSCKIRSFDPQNGWKEIDGSIFGRVQCNCGSATEKAFYAICDFNAAKKFDPAKVEYPEILLDPQFAHQRKALKENVLASHQWFTRNYRLGDTAPQKKLPEILDEKGRTLEKYTATGIRNGDMRR